MSEIKSSWLEGFQSHKEWFESLQARAKKGEISRAMQLNYTSGLRQLVEFIRTEHGGDIEANPDTIIEWAKSVEPKEVMKILYKFEDWLQGKEVEGYEKRDLGNRKKHLNPLSSAQKAHGMIRGFFTHNGVLLPKSGRKTTGRAATKKNDANFAIFKIDPNTNLIVKDYAEVRFFLSHLTPRDQTIALCMISTGQDSSDVLNLDVGFVTGQANRERLYWEGTRNKTCEEFRTFFSREATEFLRRYIAQERQGAEPHEKIFTRGDWTKEGEERVSDEKPMTARNLGLNYNTAAKRMGITNGDTQNPLRPKRMRSIFSSACYQANIDDGLRHIFMGHMGTVSERYREMPPANLEQKYALVEPFVTVFSEDRSQELDEAKKRSQTAIDLSLDVKEESKSLREENKKLREMVEQLAERLGNLEGLKERIEELEENAFPEKEVLRKEAERIKKETK